VNPSYRDCTLRMGITEIRNSDAGARVGGPDLFCYCTVYGTLPYVQNPTGKALD